MTGATGSPTIKRPVPALTTTRGVHHVWADAGTGALTAPATTAAATVRVGNILITLPSGVRACFQSLDKPATTRIANQGPDKGFSPSVVMVMMLVLGGGGRGRIL